MIDVCNPREVRELLDKYGLAPKKGFGQNFLIQPNVPQRIAEMSRSFAPMDKPAAVLEIGPGVGALTQFLSEYYDRVTAVEIDTGLIPLLGMFWQKAVLCPSAPTCRTISPPLC